MTITVDLVPVPRYFEAALWPNTTKSGSPNAWN